MDDPKFIFQDNEMALGSFAQTNKEKNDKEKFEKISLANRSRNGGSYANNPWSGKATAAPTSDLSNIDSGVVPWSVEGDSVSISKAIELVQKAYYNFSALRMTIDINAEFANSTLYFEGENKKAVKFFEDWDKGINGWNHRGQFFREYFRSGNIFLFRLDADGQDLSLKDFISDTGIRTKKAKIPVRYIMLDPTMIRRNCGLNFEDQEYKYILNPAELDKIRKNLQISDVNKRDPQVQKMIKLLGPNITSQIKKNADVTFPLDESLVHTVFTKKQDYEPFAVPLYFPVLYDINLKLEFKKAEIAIAKATDYIILMITVGSKDHSPQAQNAMIQHINGLFQNYASIGRVFVSDYSTKGEFLIPDLNKILGPEKYKVVNEDIANGLMNIFFKDEKFANGLMKMKVFLERLNEARNAYLNEFLIPEMERIGKEVGFRSIPTPKFTDVDLRDDVQFLKLYNRLAELGFLTPNELFDAYENNRLPTMPDSVKNQEEFKKLKEMELYEPQVGGNKSDDGRPEGTDGIPQDNQTISPIGASTLITVNDFKENVEAATALIDRVKPFYKEQYNLQRLSKKHDSSIVGIAEMIIASYPKEEWSNDLISKACSGDIEINTDYSNKLAEIASEHNINLVQASLLIRPQEETKE